jgi:YggT family protein
VPDVVNNVLAFLVNALFDIYLIILLLRILLALVQANFYNPFSQLIVSLTDPLLRPLRRLIPSYQRLDVAALVLLFVVKVIQLILLALIANIPLSLGPLLGIAIVQLLELLIYIYIFAIFAQVIISWFTLNQRQGRYHPAASVLHSLTEPLLGPLRRMLPVVGMLDLSPLVALLVLNVALIVLRSF